MEDRGASATFLLCKIGMAFAAIAFIGFALYMYSSSTRLAEMQDLEAAANAITSAIEKIDDFPGEFELHREMPASPQHFEVTITGEREGGLQTIHVCVASTAKVERSLIVSTIVNGGDFLLSLKNPREIVVRKSSTILLELI